MLELAEVAREFSWKHWATDTYVNRQRIIDEVVDVHHFTGGMLVALGVTDDEYEQAYRRKQDENRARMASGTYTARKDGQ